MSIYFSYAHPDISLRIITISAIAVLQYCFIVYLLSGPGPRRIHMPRRGLAVLFTVYAVLNIYRAWQAHLHNPRRLLSADATSTFSFLTPDSHRRHDRSRSYLARHGAAPK
jgi:hypothetical protein